MLVGWGPHFENHALSVFQISESVILNTSLKDSCYLLYSQYLAQHLSIVGVVG